MHANLNYAYANNGAVRLLAILPWFALLFATIASVMLFVAASRVRRLEAGGDSDFTNKASATSNAKSLDTMNNYKGA